MHIFIKLVYIKFTFLIDEKDKNCTMKEMRNLFVNEKGNILQMMM
jgi:hypothetical protein